MIATKKNIVKNIIGRINFENEEIIVAFGSGNAVMTKMILENIKPKSVLFVFETNEHSIIDLCNINDKRLVIINADAENAKIILKNRYKVEKVDFIISTIPFTFFERRKKNRIISRSYSLLKEKGKFITTQYTLLIYKLIKEQFSEISINPTVMNMPPVLIEGIK